jgi:hypothetical protein
MPIQDGEDYLIKHCTGWTYDPVFLMSATQRILMGSDVLLAGKGMFPHL